MRNEELQYSVCLRSDEKGRRQTKRSIHHFGNSSNSKLVANLHGLLSVHVNLHDLLAHDRLRREIGEATIAQIGSQLEPISPSLLAALRLPVTAISTEFGLRVHVTTPRGLTLRPGEQVDVIIRE